MNVWGLWNVECVCVCCAVKERCPPRQKSRVERLKAKVEPLLTYVTVETRNWRGGEVRDSRVEERRLERRLTHLQTISSVNPRSFFCPCKFERPNTRETKISPLNLDSHPQITTSLKHRPRCDNLSGFKSTKNDKIIFSTGQYQPHASTLSKSYVSTRWTTRFRSARY